jgi:intracellular sulfur oxidation DsrE/DsrF family protein
MNKSGCSRVLLATFFFICFGVAFAGNSANAQTEQTLHIDVPVKLANANVVFDVGHLLLWGDAPFVLGDMHALASDYAGDHTQGQIVAVFHGDAAYLVLNDESYNAKYNAQTGNPYAKLLTALMQQGVQIELCGATAKANHWGNANLLPGVKVNTDAMARVTQLEQQGYTLIYE